MKPDLKASEHYERIAEEHGAEEALDRACAAIDKMNEWARVHMGDMERAAGELRVPMPEPGTDMARVLSANSILRQRCERYRHAVIECIEAMRQLHALPQVQNDDMLRQAWATAILPILCKADDIVHEKPGTLEG